MQELMSFSRNKIKHLSFSRGYRELLAPMLHKVEEVGALEVGAEAGMGKRSAMVWATLPLSLLIFH